MVNPMERRKSVRVRIVVHLKHAKMESGSIVGESAESFTRDLSTGGLSFASLTAYKLEDPIHLAIDLPGWKNKTENVIGKVVRCQEVAGAYLIGVQFITIDKEFQDSLSEYVY